MSCFHVALLSGLGFILLIIGRFFNGHLSDSDMSWDIDDRQRGFG